jgi:regulator of sigma E protease
MITIHEFGHYIAGSILKFKINEFAIGFGPAIFKHRSKKKGQLFSIRAIPLGGYCAFEGEDTSSESSDAFDKKAPWKRIIVLLAGATMNYILALIVIIISFFAFGQMAYKVNSVEQVEGYSTEYSLAEGDVLVKAEGKVIYLITDLSSALSGKKQGDDISLTVLRDGQLTDVTVQMSADYNIPNSKYVSRVWSYIGVGTYYGEDGESKYYDLSVANVKLDFGQTIGRSFVYSYKVAGTIFKVIGELFTGNLGIDAMGGPVTTIKTTSEMAVQGMQSLLEITAYIGVNLAVFNLLPIPALDGSKIVFCIIEWICKKPVPKKIEAVIHVIGFVFIIGFAILVDILQFI